MYKRQDPGGASGYQQKEGGGGRYHFLRRFPGIQADWKPHAENRNAGTDCAVPCGRQAVHPGAGQLIG